MKILFFQEHLYPTIGGAEKSVATLIEELKKYPQFKVGYLHKDNFTEKSIELVKDYDVVVTQLDWSELGIKAAQAYGKKSILFIRSFESICKVADVPEVISHCNQQCRGCSHRKRPEAIADIIVANSRYTQQFLKEQHRLESQVIYPFIDFEEIKAPPKLRKYITMNQFAYHKGADIFIKIAEALPERNFRIVGYQCWVPGKKLPTNLRITGAMPAKNFFGDTSIFLAPARWNETFGRTLVESHYNRIPVIASARGAAKVDGLVDEELLIEDIENIDEWTKRIEIILSDYQSFVNRSAHFDFKEYELSSNIENFISLLESLQKETTVANHGL